jgi:hypothetical protein
MLSTIESASQPGDAGLTFEEHGGHAVKGLERPVEVFSLAP